MTQQSLMEVLQRLINGDITPLLNINFMNDASAEAMRLLNKQGSWDSIDISNADLLLRISNIAYNNTSLTTLPLDDGVYDQLLVVYKRYDPHYQVGAAPVQFQEQAQNEFEDEKVMCIAVDVSDDTGKPMFVHDLHVQHTDWRDPMRPKNMCMIVRDPISKRLINTTHKYPELVGTLDKCKFVLNHEAKEKGVFDKPSVAIFERDYIQPCLENGIITPIENFEMIGELKYDGVSVEAEVCGDKIISALSRGDTADNLATDLTPILGGYQFPNAGTVPKDINFGIKFEAVITKRDLEYLGEIRGKSYKNCRNAIIGLFSASDAYKYIDFITLIPLSCSLDMPRLSELRFLNNYYNSGHYNRFCIMRGNYQSMLFQVNEFVKSAEYIRPVLPYLIDGVVMSFTNPDKIKKLGRENSVNKYQMAIKFNPKKARTIFLGYSYNIGKSGEVIPMVHFKPCEFLGGIHTKQTIHSLDRFNDLNLAVGEEIDVDYVNDVITYITKPDSAHNRELRFKPREKFIEVCPYCGARIEISPSGKSARCPNIYCHERRIMRMVDMIDRLGFKDFGEERVRLLDLTTLNQIFNMTYEQASKLGPNIATSFLQYVNTLKQSSIPDYRVMSAMSFDGIADEKWKLVFTKITLSDLITYYLTPEMQETLKHIPGIGNKTVMSIINGLNAYVDDIKAALANIHIIDSIGAANRPKAAITGFRDPAFIEIVNGCGYDCSDSYGVTKSTAILIAADPNENSGKVQKAQKYGIPIFSRQQFLEMNNVKL